MELPLTGVGLCGTGYNPLEGGVHLRFHHHLLRHRSADELFGTVDGHDEESVERARIYYFDRGAGEQAPFFE